MKSLESNINKLYIFSFLDGLIIYVPFIVYYFQQLGFSLTSIAMFSASSTIAILIMEIPSGYIADRIGRRNSLVLSTVFHIISMLFLYFTRSFFSLVIAHVFLGLCMAFWSGADSALVYDTLYSLKRQEEYSKVYGRFLFYAELGIIASSLLGAGLVWMGVSILSTILVTLALQLLMPVLLFTLVEPPRHKLIEPMPFRKEFSMMWRIIKESVRHGKLMGIFLYSFIVLGVMNTIFLFYQPYFNATGLPVYSFGIVFALFSVVTAITAVKVHAIEKRLGVFYSLLVMPLLLVGSLLGAGILFVWFGFMFFFLREVVRGMIFTILSDYVNRLTTSERRATVHSIGSMFARVGYSVIAIGFGYFSGLYSLRVMQIVMGLVLLVVTLIFSVLMKKKNNPNPQPF